MAAWMCLATAPLAVAANAATPLATGEQALSFEQASQRLLEVSDGIQAAEANLAGKEDLAAATRSLRLPDIALDAREIKFQKSLELPLGQLGTALEPLGIPPTLELDQRDWRFRPTVSMTMPVYTGGQIPAARRAAAAGARQADAERQSETQDQLVALVQAYFGQQLAEHALKVRRDVRDGLQRHLDDAGKLERAGMATRAQRLQATVARDQAERELERAERDLDTLTTALSQLLRMSRTVLPTTPLAVSSHRIGDEADFRQAAADHHPALARLRAQVAQAEEGVKIQQARLKPQVFLFGQRDLKRSDALFTDADWVFGIGLKYTFMSASNRPLQVSAARQQYAQAEAGLREAENRVAIGVTQAWNQLEATREQFMLLDSSMDNARENLRLQELSFREGQATSLDVIDGRLRLGNAAIERAQAAYQYELALAQLLEISGQMGRYADYLKHADYLIPP